nr:MAG TPA: hypothetical protein [Caudoviricetes sp.]
MTSATVASKSDFLIKANLRSRLVALTEAFRQGCPPAV